MDYKHLSYVLYKEDFKRDGFLGVSPSGHIYTHFRNQTTIDTAYDVTD